MVAVTICSDFGAPPKNKVFSLFPLFPHLSPLSRVRLFVTLQTVARQAPLWDSPYKNTGVGCDSILQAIFPTQGLNSGLLCLLPCKQLLYCLASREAPRATLS